MASKNGKNNKKVIDYSKKERKVKQYLLLDSSLYQPDSNNAIDGKQVISVVKKFGKEYFKVKNNVSSL